MLPPATLHPCNQHLIGANVVGCLCGCHVGDRSPDVEAATYGSGLDDARLTGVVDGAGHESALKAQEDQDQWKARDEAARQRWPK